MWNATDVMYVSDLNDVVGWDFFTFIIREVGSDIDWFICLMKYHTQRKIFCELTLVTEYTYKSKQTRRK